MARSVRTDWGRREVERNDVDARPIDDRRECGIHRATLEYVKEGENDARNVDDGHGQERGVAEERVGSPHAVVENHDRRLGLHDRGVVQDGEGLGALLERRFPL
jgi:hypothetical protein